MTLTETDLATYNVTSTAPTVIATAPATGVTKMDSLNITNITAVDNKDTVSATGKQMPKNLYSPVGGTSVNTNHRRIKRVTSTVQVGLFRDGSQYNLYDMYAQVLEYDAGTDQHYTGDPLFIAYDSNTLGYASDIVVLTANKFLVYSYTAAKFFTLTRSGRQLKVTGEVSVSSYAQLRMARVDDDTVLFWHNSGLFQVSVPDSGNPSEGAAITTSGLTYGPSGMGAYGHMVMADAANLDFVVTGATAATSFLLEGFRLDKGANTITSNGTRTVSVASGANAGTPYSYLNTYGSGTGFRAVFICKNNSDNTYKAETYTANDFTIGDSISPAVTNASFSMMAPLQVGENKFIMANGSSSNAAAALFYVNPSDGGLTYGYSSSYFDYANIWGTDARVMSVYAVGHYSTFDVPASIPSDNTLVMPGASYSGTSTPPEWTYFYATNPECALYWEPADRWILSTTLGLVFYDNDGVMTGSLKGTQGIGSYVADAACRVAGTDLKVLSIKGATSITTYTSTVKTTYDLTSVDFDAHTRDTNYESSLTGVSSSGNYRIWGIRPIGTGGYYAFNTWHWDGLNHQTGIFTGNLDFSTNPSAWLQGNETTTDDIRRYECGCAVTINSAGDKAIIVGSIRDRSTAAGHAKICTGYTSSLTGTFNGPSLIYSYAGFTDADFDGDAARPVYHNHSDYTKDICYGAFGKVVFVDYADGSPDTNANYTLLYDGTWLTDKITSTFTDSVFVGYTRASNTGGNTTEVVSVRKKATETVEFHTDTYTYSDANLSPVGYVLSMEDGKSFQYDIGEGAIAIYAPGEQAVAVSLSRTSDNAGEDFELILNESIAVGETLALTGAAKRIPAGQDLKLTVSAPYSVRVVGTMTTLT